MPVPVPVPTVDAPPPGTPGLPTLPLPGTPRLPSPPLPGGQGTAATPSPDVDLDVCLGPITVGDC